MLKNSNLIVESRFFYQLVFIIFTLSCWVTLEPAPFDVSVIFLFLICCVTYSLTYRSQMIIPFISIWLFLINNLFSMYFMKDSFIGINYFCITLFLVIFWFMIVGLLHSSQESMEEAILNGYALAGTLSATIGILAFLQLLPNSDIFLFLGRAKGLFQDPNVFGPFLIPVAILSILRFESASTVKRKFLWLYLFTMMTIAVFLSFSRGAWINYFISFFVFFICWILISKNNSELIRRNGYLVIVILLFLIGILLISQSSNILDLFETRFGLQKYDNNRFTSQLNVLSTIIDYPFGVGPGQSDSISHLSPHSLYIRILGENGVCGFLSFITFLTITWLRSLYLSIILKKPVYLLCTACLLGLFVNSLVIDTIHWRHFWLLLALPWSFEIKSGGEVEG